jgi:hypothetical protein
MENAFNEGEALEVRVFASPTPRFTAFNDSSALLWHATGFAYAHAFESLEQKVEVPITDALLTNRTLFVVVFVTKAGASPDPRRDNFDRWATTTAVHELVAYDKRKVPVGLHNLLTGEPAPWESELRRGEAEAIAAGRPADEFIAYWKPTMHAQLLVDTEAYPVGQMPPLMHHFLHSNRLISGHRFRPLVYVRACACAQWRGARAHQASARAHAEVGPTAWYACGPRRADQRTYLDAHSLDGHQRVASYAAT